MNHKLGLEFYTLFLVESSCLPSLNACGCLLGTYHKSLVLAALVANLKLPQTKHKLSQWIEAPLAGGLWSL